jgi:hypothetical protein
MASRYWVGGSGNWDASTTTNWSATSGGAGGASVPTNSDDVFFNAASGAVTVTVTATANCNNLTFTGFTGTFAGISQVSLYGSVLAVSGMTWAHSGLLLFVSGNDKTITSAGKTLGPVTINCNSGTTVSLSDAFSSSGAITVTTGNFTTNNNPVTASSLVSSNSNTRTINLGSSTVTLNGTGTQLNFTTSTGLTFNAGTSTISSSGTSIATFIPGGVNLYNVAFTNAGAGTITLTGSATFNNLSFVGPSAAGVTQVTFDSPVTINGTLSTTGTAGNRRIWFRGVTYGIAQTLTINSAPSLTDADFRDIYVIGTAAPISGTRIGDLRGCSGITFSAPKTVYWATAAGGNWSGTNWAASAGGATSDANFPLAQDTATFVNTGLNTSATVTIDTAITNLSGINMSARTNAMTLSPTNNPTIYGDLSNGSGTTLSGGLTTTFSGRNTQTITSAGKLFSVGIIVDSYGGTVQFADAVNLGANGITVTNGTFDTKGYAVTAASLSSSNSNVRTINLGASTLTFSASGLALFSTSANLTFNAGTSQINCTSAAGVGFGATGLTFYNVSFTGTTSATHSFAGSSTYNNITITAPASAGLVQCSFSGNQTINGTLTCAGASANQRIFLRSDTVGTNRTLTVNSLSANDCDFRDITIAGAAAGASPTRAGDCGGNSGITFPSPKTVYWNLTGVQNWSATAWATSSGGSPAANNFPLAQDTAVFDNTGSAGTIAFDALWNIGTVNASARTSAMTLANGTSIGPTIYGNWSFGTGVTSGSFPGTTTFSGRGTQTITNNGVTFGCPVTIDCYTGTVQLADALTLTSARTLTLTSGTFDAVSYNVTVGLATINPSPSGTLKMGSGTWTLSGTGVVWTAAGSLTFYKGTANIVLSDTSTTVRTFAGGSLSYNKLTIGGTTGTSTLTFSGNNQFTELASTKTVAHTINLGTTVTTTVGKWSVSGSAGNVVSLSGTFTLIIAGARVSGVDYLSNTGVGSVSSASPGEFYAGANSTNPGGGANFILTAAPAAVTRYWVGGTGTWDATTTTNWSATSGGAGGASVPTSADAVVFNTLSNATAYTVTCTATQLRCAALTMAGPLSGNVTWAGNAPLAIHGNVSLAASGITRTYTGAITLSSSSTGLTFTTNGNTLASTIEVNGVGCGWTLGSALTTTSTATYTNGTFNTGNFAFTVLAILSGNSNDRTISLGSSTVTAASATPISFTTSTNLTLNSGTSTLSLSSASPTFAGGGLTYYNVSFTSTGITTNTIQGANTFNNLSVAGKAVAGVSNVIFNANQIINGTLTLSAGTDATCRTFVQSDTIGTTRTLTCAAVASLTDIDFRDITIAGAAAPVSGTRLGDCKGNSGITFPAPKTVYYRNTIGNWGATTWSFTNNGTADITAFPLAQDTAVFPSSPVPYPSSGQTSTFNASYNIGTIDMSARTSNTMTFATGTTTPTIYGNWINGTGTTLTGTVTLTFAGRGSQTITSAGKTFTQAFIVNTPSGSVTLQDAFNSSYTAGYAVTVTAGTFDASTYNVTTPTGSTFGFSSQGANTRTVAIGSGTWVIGSSGTAWNATSTNLTVTGTGTISLTNASAKTFAGGGVSYSNITLDQGGAGALTITGNNTFKNITNSYSATGATNITLGTTTQTLTQFTGTGTAGKLLTIQGTSASSPGTLILTSGSVSVNYLTITGVRAYSLSSTWYAGANSVNNGSLGWIFSSGVGNTGNFFLMF